MSRTKKPSTLLQRFFLGPVNVFRVLFSELDGAEIPNCTEKPLQETSLQRATDIEKILLSLPRHVKTYPLWIHHDSVSGQKYV